LEELQKHDQKDQTHFLQQENSGDFKPKLCVRIEDDGLGFYFIFSYFFLSKEYKTKKTNCDMVTEVTHSHDTKKSIEDSGTR